MTASVPHLGPLTYESDTHIDTVIGTHNRATGGAAPASLIHSATEHPRGGVIAEVSGDELHLPGDVGLGAVEETTKKDDFYLVWCSVFENRSGTIGTHTCGTRLSVLKA